MKARHDPELLTQIQICRRFGFCDETWRRWRKAGRVPAPVDNLPGRPKWDAKQIERWRRGQFLGTRRRAYFGSATA